MENVDVSKNLSIYLERIVDGIDNYKDSWLKVGAQYYLPIQKSRSKKSTQNTVKRAFFMTIKCFWVSDRNEHQLNVWWKHHRIYAPVLSIDQRNITKEMDEQLYEPKMM